MKKLNFRKVVSVLLVFVLAFGIMSVGLAADKSVLQPSEPGVLEIYITPNGQNQSMTVKGITDESAGTKSNPVSSLEQAEQIIKSRDEEAKLSRSAGISRVNVHVAKGKYKNERIKWEKMPANTTINVIGEEGAVFEGNGTGTFFEINNEGTNTVYNISDLNVENYDDGLILYGVSNSIIDNSIFSYLNNSAVTLTDRAIWNTPYDPDPIRTDDNVVSGNTFQYIGNGYVENSAYTGVVRVVGGNRNTIRNNMFYNIENTRGNPASLHAIYLATYACDNQIINNRFWDVTGDVIRIRHGSNNNTVKDCTFLRAGYTAYCSDWYTNTESPSYGNKFINNTVQKGVNGYWKTLPFQNIVIYIQNGKPADIAPADSSRLQESGTIYN